MEKIHVSQEIDDKFIGGFVKNFIGRADLLDASLVHDHDPVGHFQGLVLVVGDKDAGDMNLIVQLTEPATQSQANFGIQGAERLVEEQYLGLDGQGSGQGHALPLSAGELGGQTIFQALELDEMEQVCDPLADFLAGGALGARPDAQAEGDVLKHRHVAEQGVVLKYESHVPLPDRLVGDVLPVKEHRARRFIRLFQSGNDAEQGCFARARRPQESDQLSVGNGQGDIAQGGKLAEGLGDVGNGDAHAATPCGTGSLWRRGLVVHSNSVLAISVTTARSTKTDETAKAACSDSGDAAGRPAAAACCRPGCWTRRRRRRRIHPWPGRCRGSRRRAEPI